MTGVLGLGRLVDMVQRLKQWWKWRKYKKSDWPYHYTGPSQSFIEHGLPLQIVGGPKGAKDGRRFLSPDGMIRLIHKREVKKR